MDNTIHFRQKGWGMQKLRSTVVLLTSAIIVAASLSVGFSTMAAEKEKKSGAGKVAVSSTGQSNKRSEQSSGKAGTAVTGPTTEEVGALKEQLRIQQEKLRAQQEQLEQLRLMMSQMMQRLNEAGKSAQTGSAETPNVGQVASLTPVVPAGPKANSASYPALSPVPGPGKAPVTEEQMQGYTHKVETLSKTVDTLNRGLAGFKFSGDVRYRTDAIWRSANTVGGPQQNVRERYRVRINVDKAIDDRADVHLQLGSGTFNNPITFDTDFAGVNNRGPIFVTEFYGAYHPNKNVDFRGGKMQEVFAENDRFLLDDDIRFNGFQESGKIPFSRNAMGVKSIEFSAGQYILTNPNVQVLPSAKACTPAPPQTITSLPATISPPATLPANCAYLAAGFLPGGKVRATNLFDQGVTFVGDIKEGWSHRLITNVQLWRNQDALALASTSAGFPVLVNPYFGLLTSSSLPGTGNATTTRGGAIYTASRFQVGRAAYRLTYSGLKTTRQNFPIWVEVEGGRNFGTSFARNAWMGTLSVGEVKKFGDVRFLYIYAYKDVNSMISQVTDDDLGTGTGVNIRTHGIRFDVGLSKYLEWDNKLWIQDPVRGNDPARKIFVPVPTGVDTAYRVQSEFLVKF